MPAPTEGDIRQAARRIARVIFLDTLEHRQSWPSLFPRWAPETIKQVSDWVDLEILAGPDGNPGEGLAPGFEAEVRRIQQEAFRVATHDLIFLPLSLNVSAGLIDDGGTETVRLRLGDYDVNDGYVVKWELPAQRPVDGPWSRDLLDELVHIDALAALCSPKWLAVRPL